MNEQLIGCDAVKLASFTLEGSSEQLADIKRRWLERLRFTEIVPKCAVSNSETTVYSKFFGVSDLVRLTLQWVPGDRLVHLRRVCKRWRDLIPLVPTRWEKRINYSDPVHHRLPNLRIADCLTSISLGRFTALEEATVDGTHWGSLSDPMTSLTRLIVRQKGGIIASDQTPSNSLNHVSQFPNLRCLRISAAPYRFGELGAAENILSLSLLTHLDLDLFSLQTRPVSSEPCVLFTQLTNMRYLRTQWGTWIASAGARTLSSLQSLSLLPPTKECNLPLDPFDVYQLFERNETFSARLTALELMVTDDYHLNLTPLAHLQTLILRCKPNSVAHLLPSTFLCLPKLEYLELHSVAVPHQKHPAWQECNKGLPFLRRLLLESVFAADALLSHLGRSDMNSLRSLEVHCSSAVATGIKVALVRYPSLSVLSLRVFYDMFNFEHCYDTSFASSEPVVVLSPSHDYLTSLTNLTRLFLYDESVPDLSLIARLPLLRNLLLESQELSPAGLLKLSPLQSSLRTLHMRSFCDRIRLRELAASHFPELYISSKPL